MIPMARARTLFNEQIRQALLLGPANGAELANRLRSAARAGNGKEEGGLEVSQPTLSRRLGEMAARGEVVQLGEKRGRCNYLPRALNGSSCWPLYQVFADGSTTHLGQLYRVYPGFAWQLGASCGHSENFPWWLMDLLPQGYLGRALAEQQGVATDGSGIWSEDATLRHLERLDLTGDLLIGERSYLAYIHQGHTSAAAGLADLAQIAKEQGLQAIGGSSAGGEQPKFVRQIAPYGSASSNSAATSPRAPTPGAGPTCCWPNSVPWHCCPNTASPPQPANSSSMSSGSICSRRVLIAYPMAAAWRDLPALS